MAIKQAPGKESLVSPPTLASPYLAQARYLLLFSQADGSTTGFPLTWLYQVERQGDGRKDRLTFRLTEHCITVEGRQLGELLEQVKKGEGFHASERPHRYTNVPQYEEAFISRITIEPSSKTNHEGDHTQPPANHQ